MRNSLSLQCTKDGKSGKLPKTILSAPNFFFNFVCYLSVFYYLLVCCCAFSRYPLLSLKINRVKTEFHLKAHCPFVVVHYRPVEVSSNIYLLLVYGCVYTLYML